jgi:hypothetical protein
MLKNFIALYTPIQAVVTISKSKAFKDKRILLSKIEIQYLKNYLSILSIFTRATTKLQAEEYPTIYYLIPEIYRIYNRLETFKKEFQNISYYKNIKINSKYLYTNCFLIRILYSKTL